MTTIAEVVDSVYRRYLEPPDSQPATFRIASDMGLGVLTVTIEGFDIAEDENLLRQGSIIEGKEELMRVVSWDVSLSEIVVLRAQLGTEEQAHLTGDTFKLSPPYPRVEVVEAVGQNVIGLSPRLQTVRTAVLGSAGQGVYPIDDDLATEVIAAYPNNDRGGRLLNFHAQVVSTHPRTGQRTVVLNQAADSSVWVRYRRRMAVPSGLTDTLEDVGVEETWANVVTVGAAADMLAGRDITASHSDWVGSVLEAESIPVGTRGEISVGLARYRELLISRFEKEQKGEDSHGISVHMNDPFASVV